MSSPITLSGSCLCGGVKYRVAGAVLTAVNCHCSMCRKAHGAAFRSGVIVKVRDLSWVQGEALVVDYKSSEQIHRFFCRTCGSHMLARSDLYTTIASIAVATLDGDLPFGIAQHWNVASKAAWFEITDALPQYAVTPS